LSWVFVVIVHFAFPLSSHYAFEYLLSRLNPVHIQKKNSLARLLARI